MSPDDARGIRARIRQYVAGKGARKRLSWASMMNERPVVHCLAAFQQDDGEVWGHIHRVSLETADWMRQIGYVIVGPDPMDLCDLARWEREQKPTK